MTCFTCFLFYGEYFNLVSYVFEIEHNFLTTFASLFVQKSYYEESCLQTDFRIYF